MDEKEKKKHLNYHNKSKEVKKETQQSLTLKWLIRKQQSKRRKVKEN